MSAEEDTLAFTDRSPSTWPAAAQWAALLIHTLERKRSSGGARRDDHHDGNHCNLEARSAAVRLLLVIVLTPPIARLVRRQGFLPSRSKRR